MLPPGGNEIFLVMCGGFTDCAKRVMFLAVTGPPEYKMVCAPSPSPSQSITDSLSVIGCLGMEDSSTWCNTVFQFS